MNAIPASRRSSPSTMMMNCAIVRKNVRLCTLTGADAMGCAEYGCGAKGCGADVAGGEGGWRSPAGGVAAGEGFWGGPRVGGPPGGDMLGGCGGWPPGGWGGSAATIALLLKVAVATREDGCRILDFADHERAGHLVVPALLARVERGPDEADGQHDRADEVADETADRSADADVLPGCCVDDMEAEQPLTERPAEL